MSYETIVLENDGDVSLLKLNRPEELNAINELMLKELAGALIELDHHAATKAIIITGCDDRAFSVGLDVKALRGMSVSEAAHFAEMGHEALAIISRMDKVVIAAVRGVAYSAAFEIALACDMIFAAEGAALGFPDLSLGLLPGFGGAQRLIRLCGLPRAKELLFTGRRISAQEAQVLGLINGVAQSADLVEKVKKFISDITRNSPMAVALAKKVMNGGADLPIDAAMQLDRQAFPLSFATDDAREGMEAFLEKRKPIF